MKTIIFIFGSNPQISLVELNAVLGPDVLKLMAREPLKASLALGECALAELPDDADIPALQERLGGTVKIGQLVGRVKENDLSGALKNILEKENKFVFGISAYSVEGGVNIKAIQAKMKNIG